MRILPAIDLKDGLCVRLEKGDFNTTHQVAKSVLETANMFKENGAEMIHMVDLDAAKTGSRKNYEIVADVIKQTKMPIELGGGIRNMDDLAYAFSIGVSRAVIGSAAVKNPAFVREAVDAYGEKVAVGIDALSGTIRTEGWLEDSKEDYISFAKSMEDIGVKVIIFTDIDKDGMLQGPNFEQLSALRKAVSCKIVASGGVSTLEQVEKLNEMGIDEAIAGKAVYTGLLPLKEAIERVR